MDAMGNPSDRETMRDRFFKAATTADGSLRLDAKWMRDMCGGLTLKSVGNVDLDPYSIIWNVRTYKEVIPDHNGITTLPLRDFVEQIYGDLLFAPRINIAR